MDSLIIYGVEGKKKWGVSLKNFRRDLMSGKGGEEEEEEYFI